jgi:putative isomerase
MRNTALFVALCFATTSATINLATFSSTAFAGGRINTLPDAISSAQVPPLSSLRYTGTVASGTADLILFRAAFASPLNGSLLVWIDDHLVIDHAARGLSAYINFSFTGTNPLPLRIDLINAAPTPTTFSLLWHGNFTPDGVVPAAALTSDVTPHALQREAMRERMVSPPWEWGTYENPSMGTHVAMPSAFAITATLGRRSTGAVLGNIIVYRQANPAIVRVGGHSYNGSTFTELSVGYWGGTACTTVLQTALGQSGLMFLATTNGTDCDDLVLVLSFGFLWERVGGVTEVTPGHITATPAGLSSVDVFTAAPPVAFNGSLPGVHLALALQSGTSTGYSTGTAVSLADMAAAIAVARAQHESSRSRYGPSIDLMDAYDAQQSVIAWNTMFTPYEGVVTPVSRGWNHGSGYVLFDWDNLFLAWMASMEAASLDIAYSNLIQVVQGRTVYGFVPNYHSGTHDSGDRSEPQLGAQLTLLVYTRWKDDWVGQTLFDTLLGWQEWIWTMRMYPHAAGPLVVLGSDPNYPEDEGGMGTFFRAVLESGIDNGIAYMLNETGDWDSTLRRVKQWDVGASALFVAECLALAELAPVAGRGDIVATLTARAAAVSAAMEAAMWNSAEGVYENTLWNGTWNKRRMPTAFYPLLAAQLPPARAAAMLPLLTSPLGFCVNNTAFGAGDANSTLLLQFASSSQRGGHALACASDACVADAINARFTWKRAEGLVQLASAPSASAPVPLFLWENTVTGGFATFVGDLPPAPGFTQVRVEGFCSAVATGRAEEVPLSLWSKGGSGDIEFMTCAGNPACAADATKGGYAVVNASMCWGFNATTAEQLPCKFSCNSAARNDPNFFDNDYWRGRIWGPQVALVWLGLQKYDAVPEIRAARGVLVAQALKLELQEWRLFRQVTENHNGIFGVGEDVGNADPFYHWGALLGHVALMEAGY